MSEQLVTIHTSDTTLTVRAGEGNSVLEAIRLSGAAFSAPCGGKGSCGKCGVFIRDARGLSYHLACQTPIAEGMSVEIESAAPLLIEDEGLTRSCTPDVGLSGLGVAVDIGTTTLASRLFDLSNGSLLASATLVNPQIVFGSDVISRIDVSMAGSLGALHKSITGALERLIAELCHKADRSPDAIARIVLAGNTVMEHIVCGLAPDSIGVSPFEPLTHFGDLHTIPGLSVPAVLAPCVAGYVGGDITSGILATGMHTADLPTLLIDLGTNGEMALGSKDGLSCCATAAGPVFEGANIRYGMPALPGAIHAAHDEGGQLVCETIGGGTALGICGTGLIDIIAWLLATGIVDESGLMLSATEIPTHAAQLGMEGSQGIFYLNDEHTVGVTQADVRNFQLGKSAILAGITVLLEQTGTTLDAIQHLLIAGGFGRRLDLAHAAAVGLFPRSLLDRARAVGNTSIEGASIALLDSALAEELRELPKLCHYVELSTSPRFNELFMDCLIFGETT